MHISWVSLKVFASWFLFGVKNLPNYSKARVICEADCQGHLKDEALIKMIGSLVLSRCI